MTAVQQCRPVSHLLNAKHEPAVPRRPHGVHAPAWHKQRMLFSVLTVLTCTLHCSVVLCCARLSGSQVDSADVSGAKSMLSSCVQLSHGAGDLHTQVGPTSSWTDLE